MRTLIIMVLVTSLPSLADLPVVVPASRLQYRLNENEISFNKTIRGQTLQILGIVDQVRVAFGVPSLVLTTGFPLRTVRCTFSGDGSELGDLKAGDLVVVSGTVNGKMVSGILVEGCTLSWSSVSHESSLQMARSIESCLLGWLPSEQRRIAESKSADNVLLAMEERARKELKDKKLQPLSCSHGGVMGVASCELISEYSPLPECKHSVVRETRKLLQR